MKKFYILLVISALFLITCKKLPELKIYNLEISEESVTTTTSDATISAKYSFPTEIYEIKVLVNTTNNMDNASFTVATIENNLLSATIDNLLPSTNYYYCFRYSNGINLVDTEIRNFTTRDVVLPTITTSDVTEITRTTAVCGGAVTNDGGATVTVKGVCWSTIQNPTTNDSYTSNGNGIGTFISNLTELSGETKYYVRAYATNSVGTSYGNVVEFTTLANPVLPTVTTNDMTNITQTTADGGGNVTSDGGADITERGLCWSTSHNPTISNNHASNGTGTGSYTINIDGLTANTTYYVRAYAKNDAGIAYGNQISFTTLANPVVPTVTTNEITNITQTTADGGGNVTSDGGTEIIERGICWSTSHNPTINNNHASNGTGTGSFIVNITGLTANTTYYVRAYAKNNVGTAYGDEVSFKTSATPTVPVVTTANITNITQTSATGGGNVTSNGGSNVSQRGICWSTSQNPTTNNNHVTSGIGVGNFTCNMTGLTSNTTYYVRAYAINEVGTAYGEQKSFITGSNVTNPTVTTNNVTNITISSATCGGNVTSAGNGTVNARGVCWSTSQNPTISGSHTTNGSGTGSYTSSITGLSANTTYYVRAYATNEAGTAYGSQKTFTTNTSITQPTVTTNNVTDITSTTATCGGNVTSSGNGTVTTRGVCWSTSQNPTVNNSHTTDGTGTGSFTSSITGLSANTTYYVRAYATNEAGTSYGSQKTFTTSSSVTTPTVTTNNVTDITSTTATCGGNVTSAGNGTVTARGVCWSTSSNPTISSSHTSNGSGTGTFTSSITGLTANTTYYVRAYATNEAGTAYGSEKSFTTESEQPQGPTGAINGLFSVSATQQVWFSKGNLQYKASTNTWKFADNQYDCIGSSNTNISSTYSGWIDLFCWGTSNYNHGAVCYQPWSTSEVNSNYKAYGSYTYNLNDQTGMADWGYNTISNGGSVTNMWRTLTKDEWKYLFDTRNTISGIRYVKAQVNGVKGVVLLPDNWNSNNYSLNNVNNGSASYINNNISQTNWINIFEAYGAVFLPAAGYRNNTTISDVGANGYYWSTIHYETDSAYLVYYTDSYLSPDDWGNKSFGLSVRLVQDY